MVEYTAINDPDAIKRSLLLFSRSCITALMHFEKLKLIRDQKSSLVDEFNKTIDEMRVILEQVEKILPEVKGDLSKKGALNKQVIKSHKMGKMQKLYSDLEEINKKLNSIRN